VLDAVRATGVSRRVVLGLEIDAVRQKDEDGRIVGDGRIAEGPGADDRAAPVTRGAQGFAGRVKVPGLPDTVNVMPETRSRSTIRYRR
jgi:hypothetical protein